MCEKEDSMKAGRWCCATLLSVWLVGSACSAKEFSVATPAEIAAAMGMAQPGDTLLMTAGTWTDVRLVFEGNGTAEKPITLRTPGYGTVTITGASNLRIGGTYLVVDGLLFANGYSPADAVIEFRNASKSLESSYCRLTNSGIIDFNPVLKTTDYKWVSLYGSHNRVDHCYLRGKNHQGTTLVVWLSATPNYHLIDRNHFAYRPPLGVNGGETIRVGTSDWSMFDSYTIVEENLFEECNGEMEIISSKSCENIYRHNTFRNCEGTLTLRHGNRCRVEGNVFFGNGKSSTGGIRVIGEDHVVVNNYLTGLRGTDLRSAIALMDGIQDSPLNGYFQVKRATVAFNTLVGNTASIDVGTGKDSDNILPPLDCLFANNIVTGSTGPLVRFTDTPVNLRWEGNIFWGASLGIPVPSGITIADPLLAAAGSDGLQRPTPSSPAINTAAGVYPLVSMDVDGQARQDPKDIGADEISDGPVLFRPLTAADVGPRTPTTSVGDLIRPGRPQEFACSEAYPNPFNPETTIAFVTPTDGRARVEIYNSLGELVGTPFDGHVQAAQRVKVRFQGNGLPGGSYFARVTQGEHRVVRTMVLLK